MNTGVLDATISSIGRRGVPYARVTRAASGLLLAYGVVGVAVLIGAIGSAVAVSRFLDV